MSAVPNLQLIEGGIDAANGAPTSVSTYEAMRLAVLDEVAQSKIDSRDRPAVAALVRAHVDRYQRTADSGSGRRFANPDDIGDGSSAPSSGQVHSRSSSSSQTWLTR